MLFFSKKTRYSSIEDEDYDNELKLGGGSQSPSSNIVINLNPWSLLLIIILFLTSIVCSWVLLFSNIKHSPQQEIESAAYTQPSLFCQQVPIRREWRTLTAAEQHDYIRAVRCLATKPSKLNEQGTLYDDFPWVHKQTSSNSIFWILSLSLHVALALWE